jgi:predicted HTH transcriptional regulator
MFLMIGSAEKAGSGVSKILSGWMSSHWRRPYITIDTEPDRIILELPMFSVIPENTLSALKELFGYHLETLGKDELTALAVCHIEGDVTNAKLQYTIDKHKSDITKLLQDLCKEGYLLSENKSRWTTYHLNTEYSIENILDDDTSNDDTSNDDTSNDDTIKVKELTVLQKKIIEACNIEYISIDEISIRVNKSISHLKNRIIPEMIKNGFLIRLHTKINHPEQKYISKSTNK